MTKQNNNSNLESGNTSCSYLNYNLNLIKFLFNFAEDDLVG